MSSPRVAISAISSAVAVFLDVLGIALSLLFRRFPGRDQMVELARGVVPDLKDDGTQEPAAPSDGTKLFRIVALLVGQVRLIEYLLRLQQADPVLPLDLPALLSVELEAHRYITVISSNLADLASRGGAPTFQLAARLIPRAMNAFVSPPRARSPTMIDRLAP